MGSGRCSPTRSRLRGSGFPLVTVNLVLGAVTCAGKASLLVEFVEDNVPVRTMEEINDRALGFLLEE